MSGERFTDADYNRVQAAKMTERTFQAALVGFAQRVGWMVYHTYDSRCSEPGYPDLHLVHPVQGRSLFRELKTEKGKLTPAQQKWLAALKDAGVDADVWRPLGWFDGSIAAELTHTPRTVEQKQAVITVEPPAVELDADYIPFVEQALDVELLPWQKDVLVQLHANPTGHVFYAGGRRAGRTTFRRVLNQLDEHYNPKEG
jgi:hypothetical protein